MIDGRDGDKVDEVMGRDEGDKDMELEEAQGPGRSEACEEEETTENTRRRRGAGRRRS